MVPKSARKVREVIGIHLLLTGHHLMIGFDEKTQIQALVPSYTSLSIKESQPENYSHVCRRGVRQEIAAL